MDFAKYWCEYVFIFLCLIVVFDLLAGHCTGHAFVGALMPYCKLISTEDLFLLTVMFKCFQCLDLNFHKFWCGSGCLLFDYGFYLLVCYCLLLMILFNYDIFFLTMVVYEFLSVSLSLFDALGYYIWIILPVLVVVHLICLCCLALTSEKSLSSEYTTSCLLFYVLDYWIIILITRVLTVVLNTSPQLQWTVSSQTAGICS